MLFSSFVSWVKESVLQNIAEDNFSDSKLVDTYNRAMGYMYNFLNAKGVFAYSAIEETVNPSVDNNKLFLTTYRIGGIIEDLDGTNTDTYRGNTKNTWVRSDSGSDLTRKVFIPDSTWDFYSYHHVSDGILGIKTGKTYSTLTIRYKRMPEILSIDDIKSDKLVDLPYDIVGILENIMLWRLFPQSMLENWAELANYYRTQANDELDVYAKALWWTMQRFTA